MTAVLIPTISEADWLAARRKGITASEIAVLMGLSPWSSPFALYYQKTGELPGQEDNMAMAIGRHLEAFVCDQFASLYDSRFLVDWPGAWGLFAHPDRPWQMATPDRLLYEWEGPDDVHREPIAVLEAKTSASYEGWGEDGTDVIPVHYRCQVLWQMDVLSVTTGYVACLFLHSRQLRVYEITMDDAAEADLEIMRNEANDFLYRIRLGYPPEVDWRPATSDALKRLHPDVEDRSVVIPRKLAAQYRAACAAVKAAEQRKHLAENLIRQRMGNARHAIAMLAYVARRDVYDVPAKTIERKAFTVNKLVPVVPKEPAS